MNDLRNAPTQERSRRTLAAIMESADRLFAQDGVDAATLTAIAEAAGVSIGSLYRFFPNKDALVDQYIRLYTDALEEDITDANVFPSPESDSFIEMVVDLMVNRTVEIRSRYPGYANVRVWRNSSGARPGDAVYESQHRLISALIEGSGYTVPQSRMGDVVSVVILSTYPVMGRLLEVSSKDAKSLIAELKRMLTAYLTAVLEGSDS